MIPINLYALFCDIGIITYVVYIADAVKKAVASTRNSCLSAALI
jgi:hypothetical protein